MGVKNQPPNISESPFPDTHTFALPSHTFCYFSASTTSGSRGFSAQHFPFPGRLWASARGTPPRLSCLNSLQNLCWISSKSINHQSMNQSINESINHQSINQSVNHQLNNQAIIINQSSLQADQHQASKASNKMAKCSQQRHIASKSSIEEKNEFQKCVRPRQIASQSSIECKQ